MKVIFLDFDGVLNNYKFLTREKDNSPYNTELDPKNISILNSFLEKKDYKIIISSSWTTSLNLEEIKSLFKDYENILSKIIDSVDNTNYKKSEAIKISMKTNGLLIKNIAILDDDILFPLGTIMNTRQIKTSMGTGLTEEDLLAIEKLLN